ncbi:hypothetical protein RHOER0001_4541 [Rhodococcus erythropolis SK121]|nr:hypothetical protein RHOER0001_4541 [Rhodococcus erythropolis SK121]
MVAYDGCVAGSPDGSEFPTRSVYLTKSKALVIYNVEASVVVPGAFPEDQHSSTLVPFRY